MNFRLRTMEFVKTASRKAGVELRGANTIFERRLTAAIAHRGLTHVIDVGGNVGQFGNSLFASGYSGRLLSFEPQPDAHAELTAQAEIQGSNWHVAPPMALAEVEGTATFRQFSSNALSSLLQPGERMQTAAPTAEVAKSYEVRLARLDEILPELWSERPAFALKIDTQGAERRVLEGAEGCLSQAKLVQLEASIGQLYDGQPFYYEIDTFMRGLGFELIDLEPGYRAPDSKALLEFDVVYARP